MRYWLDTEFREDGTIIDLISVGIVAEDGREFYGVSLDFNKVKLFEHSWLVENVVPSLPFQKAKETEPHSWGNSEPDRTNPAWMHRDQMRREIVAFMDPQLYNKPEIWVYYGDYDWVVLCQLFGAMIALPRDWPQYAMDIKQEAKMRGLRSGIEPMLPVQGKGEHNALADARWNKQAWDSLFPYGLPEQVQPKFPALRR